MNDFYKGLMEYLDQDGYDYGIVRILEVRSRGDLTDVYYRGQWGEYDVAEIPESLPELVASVAELDIEPSYG